jgi:hypothetical protein
VYHFSSFYQVLFMYLSLNDGVYAALYNSNVVLLDLNKNHYIILNAPTTRALLKFNSSKNLTVTETNYTDILKDAGLFVETSYKSLDLKQIKSRGTFDLKWLVPYNTLESNIKTADLFVALYFLYIVHKVVKRRKILGLKDLINKYYNRYDNYRTPEKTEIDYMESVINKACFYYFHKVKCLEWSAAFVLFSLYKKFKFNLVIGVQNYPFIAHAWPEVDEYVVGNSFEISKQLAKILVFPFNSVE